MFVSFFLASNTALNSTYINNGMESIAAKNCGIKLCQELSPLWGKNNMHVRKWISNSLNFLEKISAKIRTNEFDLSNKHLPPVKTLPVQSKINSHTTMCQLKRTFNTSSEICWEIFRHFMIHYPLGFLAPYFTREKCLYKMFVSQK